MTTQVIKSKILLIIPTVRSQILCQLTAKMWTEITNICRLRSKNPQVWKCKLVCQSSLWAVKNDLLGCSPVSNSLNPPLCAAHTYGNEHDVTFSRLCDQSKIRKKSNKDNYVLSSPKVCAIWTYPTRMLSYLETFAKTAFAVVSCAVPGLSEFYSPVASIWQKGVQHCRARNS